MTIGRIFAIIAIFILACVGWAGLGLGISTRSDSVDGRLRATVERLWGEALVQPAPVFTLTSGEEEKLSRELHPSKNDIQAEINLEHRKKGLFWYTTYGVAFGASYEVRNPGDAPAKVDFAFAFPSATGTYDGLQVMVDGEEVDVPLDIQKGIQETFALEAGASTTVNVQYKTRGLNRWSYQPRTTGLTRELNIELATNFSEIDYPEDSLSPSQAEISEDSATVTWTADGLLTSQYFGLILPEKLNPGPIAERITFFAPVCLVFFFMLSMVIDLKFKVSIHPMHYLFIAAGFFAFHFCFAYLVDVMNIHLAFAIAAGTSLLLVSLYLRAALGKAFPWKTAGAGQALYLVLFSYSFFIKGSTGLIIMISSIATLAALMAMTAKTDWNEVFASRRRPRKPGPEAMDPQGGIA